MALNTAKFSIGDVVKHRYFNFRGVIYDVDFEFNNSEEWYQSIPKNVRPRKDQPFYHLLAENNEITYEAYVSEQNLVTDDSDEPIKHPLIEEIFEGKNFNVTKFSPHEMMALKGKLGKFKFYTLPESLQNVVKRLAYDYSNKKMNDTSFILTKN